jgi:hypothetical protein
MNRVTYQRISRDLVSQRFAGRWIDCILLQSDDVSVVKSSSGGNPHSTRHFILANNRTLVPFQMPLQLMQTVTKGFSMIEPTFVTRTR